MAYTYLTAQVQRLFVDELRNFWQYHPKYNGLDQCVSGTLTDQIKGRQGDRERGQQAIVVKVGSGNPVPLAPDHFQGHVMSHIYQAHVEGYPNLCLEWIRENYVAIQNNGGTFPTAPGIYYLEFCDEHQGPTDQMFYLDRLLTVRDETPLRIQPTLYQLQNGSFTPGTLRLYRMPGSARLYEPANYTADPKTGQIVLPAPLAEDFFLSADYRYGAPTTGPWHVRMERALVEPIPGVVLAFGRKIVPGDRTAVVVSENRDLTALEFGGRWELGVDFDVIARDVNTQREILDETVQYLWAVARARLSSQGIEILTMSLGGESEDAYDDTADDPFYMGSFSLQVQTDWSVHVPLGAMIASIEPGGPPEGGLGGPTKPPYLQTLAGLSQEEMIAIQYKMRVLKSLGLKYWGARDPYYTSKIGRFPYGTGEMLL